MISIQSDDPATDYPHHRPLTRKEETYHAYRAQYYNDKKSERILVRANTLWAKTYTKEFARPRWAQANYRELLAAAVLGLYDAVYDFDPLMECKFASYANNKMLRRLNEAYEIMLNETAPRMPRSARDVWEKTRRQQRRLEQNLQKDVSIEQAAESLELTEKWKEVVIARKNQQMIPYSKRLSVYEGDQTNFEEIIPADNPSIVDIISDQQCAEMIDAGLDTLPAQAQYILNVCPAIGLSSDGSTLQSLATRMKLTRERIRQIRDEAKQKLYKNHLKLKRRKYIDSRKN